VTALESLEGRQLLAFSSLGYSLPDLRVSGSAGPVAAWGGALAVSVNLQNFGSSTTLEPLGLAPSSPSSADAAVSTIAVYITPRAHSQVGGVQIGTIQAPPLAQNDIEQLTDSFALPNRPRGFPGTGGKFYVYFRANASGSVLESQAQNDTSQSVPVRVYGRFLPLLQATALDVPATMRPGDTIRPVIQIANLGTAPTRLQGNLQVALVASVDPTFTLGSSIVGIYDIGNIASQSNTPIRSYNKNGRVNLQRAARDNLTPNNNVATIIGDPVTLPTSPATYYLGVVIDPNSKIQQLPSTLKRFQLIMRVGPNTAGLPPAGVISTGGSSNNLPFPNTPNGVSVGQG